MADPITELTAVNLPDGSRRITHPTGVVVIETAADLTRQRAELIANLVRAQEELTRFNEAIQ